MPIIQVSQVFSYYTDKKTHFDASGATAYEAVKSAVEQYPKLKFHIMDDEGKLRRHVSLFVNNIHVKELNGNDTQVGEKDTVRIVAAAAGG